MTPIACRAFGHNPEFRAEGATMQWACRRIGCPDGGSKTYGSERDAARYAATFNRRDADQIGKRAPLIGLLPLRIWRWFQRPR